MKPITTLLEQLIQFETVASNPQAMQQGIVFLSDFLRNRGITVQLNKHQKHPYLIWGAPLHETKMLINTHLDVVPGQPAQFVPRSTNKKMFGRGSADTKSFVAVLANLPTDYIRIAKQKGITFMVVTDEEVGGDTTKHIIKSMPQLGFGIFGEPTNLQIVNQAKGIAQIKVTILGKTAHGSTPWQGVNAILQLTHQLATFLQSYPLPKKDSFATTFTPTLIAGGRAINQVPEQATITFDVRINPKDSIEAVVQFMAQYFAQQRIEVLRLERAINTPTQLPAVQAFAKQVETCLGSVTFSRQHFSSDARHLSAQGIPTLIFGPTGGDLHGDREWVSLESLDMVSDILLTYILSV